MLMTIYKPRGQRGIGLLELMLSLAIISILLVMATRYYRAAHESQQVNETISAVNGIIGAETNYKVATGKYSTKMTDLVDNNYLPASGANNPWGSDQIGLAGDGSFSMTFSSIPTTTCTQRVLPLLKNSNASLATSSCDNNSLKVIYTG